MTKVKLVVVAALKLCYLIDSLIKELIDSFYDRGLGINLHCLTKLESPSLTVATDFSSNLYANRMVESQPGWSVT